MTSRADPVRPHTRILRGLLRRMLFTRSPTAYRYAKLYIDIFNGDNNDDITTNGELRLARAIVPRAAIVFDVGANIGNWASLVLSMNPTAELHCFEPVSATYEKLSTRLASTRAICNHAALSSTSGSQTMHLFGSMSGENSFYRRSGVGSPEGQRQREQESVATVRFDEYCQVRRLSKVDFCKIDVEGHELEVLSGMGEWLKGDRVGAVQFEYGGCNIDSGTRLKDVFELLRSTPYVLHKIMPWGLLQVKEYDQTFETYQYQNWVALGKDTLRKIPSGALGIRTRA